MEWFGFILKVVNNNFLKYKKVNGKLPNMDILNLAILLVEKTGVVTTINKITRRRNFFDLNGAAKTFLNGIISLVFFF
jgi:hypothetical protein